MVIVLFLLPYCQMLSVQLCTHVSRPQCPEGLTSVEATESNQNFRVVCKHTFQLI